MREVLGEVIASMKGNKMRIALTGFSIGWGIFILIGLLSSGNGLINGMKYNFEVFNIGMVTLTPQMTSLPCQGHKPGRSISFYEEDATFLKTLFGDTVVKAITVVSHPVQARCGKNYTNTTLDGYAPGYDKAPNIRIREGRDINDLDMQMQRKVCVIPARLEEVLFPKHTKPIVGQSVSLDGISFQVIGIYEPLLSENTTRTIIAPQRTVKTIYCPDGRLDRLYLQTNLLNTAEKNVAFNARMLHELATRKTFHPDDKKAVKIENLYELPVLVNSIITGLYVFVGVIGLATLLSGIVSISNIMLITVRERTHEIGIRRSIGAKGWQIIQLVLTESVIISLIFGYAGMLIAVALMELVSKVIERFGGSHVFSSPTISPAYVAVITVIIVVAGLIAGYIPSKVAVGIKLTDALAEK